MLRRLIDSHLLLWLLIAAPAAVMLWRALLAGGGLGHLLQGSGEWAARLLIITLAITPIRMIFKGRLWPLWLVRRRRDFGIAAFAYAVLHLAAYVARQSNIDVILYELQYREYVMGWTAFAAMLVLAAISNDGALRMLGRTWKHIQRLVYAAAAAAFLHWLWIKIDNLPAYVHFAPLAVLEAYRLWYNFSRPSRRRLQE